MGFVYLEGLTILNAIYLTITTITTVGYGDIIPKNTSGRIFATVFELRKKGVHVVDGDATKDYTLIEAAWNVLPGWCPLYLRIG